MLEQDLRELFEQRTAAPQPPVRASIAQAARDGRAQQRRRRRAVAIVTPMFAAGAVAAIALAVASAPGQLSPRPPRPGATVKPPPAPMFPRRFSPQYAYAAFGWLPAGASFTAGSTTPGLITLEADSTIPNATGSQAAGYSWRWSGYARGACQLRGRLLVCGGQSVMRITAQARELGGKPAYWGYGPQFPGEPILTIPDSTGPRLLAYQFAGGWATLSAPRASLFTVARTIRLAVPAQIRYPVQLDGVPASWQVAASDYFTGPAGPETWDFSVRVSATSQLAVNAAPGAGQYCEGREADIAGHHVLLSQTPGPAHLGTYSLCARGDDGTDIRLDETGRFAPGVVQLFRSDLRVLGPDPASWTTQPLN
jgi:hypothetical protein